MALMPNIPEFAEATQRFRVAGGGKWSGNCIGADYAVHAEDAGYDAERLTSDLMESEMI